MNMLLDKYQSEWDDLCSNYANFSFIDEMPANPLLLEVPPMYYEADCKVMIFGKETNGWENIFPHTGGVSHILNIYDLFYNKGGCYNRSTPFWNAEKKFERVLIEKLKPSGRSLSILWNNVIKIGSANAKGTPGDIILKWEDKWFDIVLFEIKELKPDIVIFFSGHDYDKYIRRIFSEATFERVNERTEKQLARVKSPWLPENSIRTYHPQYLYFNGLDKYLNDIIGALNC